MVSKYFIAFLQNVFFTQGTGVSGLRCKLPFNLRLKLIAGCDGGDVYDRLRSPIHYRALSYHSVCLIPSLLWEQTDSNAQTLNNIQCPCFDVTYDSVFCLIEIHMGCAISSDIEQPMESTVVIDVALGGNGFAQN